MIKNSIFARPYSQTNLYNGSDFPTNTKTRSGASAASVFVDCPSLMFVSSWDEGFFKHNMILGATRMRYVVSLIL